ncbi:MAG: alpha/beta hydrolase [Candidatus Bathyarchaeia archaeon]
MSVEEVKDYFKMSDGFNLFFRHWKAVGKAEKSIVCVHGLGRGFGNSKEEGIPRGDTRDFKRHMQDLDEAVDFVRKGYQNQKVYMFGHSLGGCYTLWYAANHPDSLDGVMLAAPNIESGLRPPRRFLIDG